MIIYKKKRMHLKKKQMHPSRTEHIKCYRNKAVRVYHRKKLNLKKKKKKHELMFHLLSVFEKKRKQTIRGRMCDCHSKVDGVSPAG